MYTLPTYIQKYTSAAIHMHIEIDCVDFRQGLLGHDLSPRHAGAG